MTAAQRAGFWRRYAAWSLDAVFLALPIALAGGRGLRAAAAAVADAWTELLLRIVRGLFAALDAGATPVDLAQRWLADPELQASMARVQSGLWSLAWPPLLAFAVLGALLHVACETSSWQATPGQRALGLRVTDAAGAPPDAARALARHAAGALSWLTLNLGHAMALGPLGLALHDRVSKTRVVATGAASRMPAWAGAWIALQGIALLAATVALVVFTRDALQTGLDALV